MNNDVESFYVLVDSEELNSLRVRIKKFKDKNYIVTLTALEKYEPYNAYQLYKLLAENAYDINLMYKGNELIYISPSVHLSWAADCGKKMNFKTNLHDAWSALFLIISDNFLFL